MSYLRVVEGPTCPRCSRVFRNWRALAQHQRAFREAVKHKTRAERLCPDRRNAEDVRALDMIKLRLMTRLGRLGRHP